MLKLIANVLVCSFFGAMLATANAAPTVPSAKMHREGMATHGQHVHAKKKHALEKHKISRKHHRARHHKKSQPQK